MSLLHGFGDGKIKVVATEDGWEDGKGKLLCSCVNLLSQRVAQGLATKEEVTRWAAEKQEQIDLRRDAVLKAQQKNKERIASIVAKFESDNAELKEKALTNPTYKIQYLVKSIDIAKLEEEYAKADAVSVKTLDNLQIREDRIKARLQAADVLVGEKKVTTESKPSVVDEDSDIKDHPYFGKALTEPTEEEKEAAEKAAKYEAYKARKAAAKAAREAAKQ